MVLGQGRRLQHAGAVLEEEARERWANDLIKKVIGAAPDLLYFLVSRSRGHLAAQSLVVGLVGSTVKRSTPSLRRRPSLAE